jgi:hypothetical protein
MNRVFTRVDYEQFRQFLDVITTGKVRNKGYETAIYDRQGDIQATVYAASIDEKGNCHPAEYHVRARSLGRSQRQNRLI